MKKIIAAGILSLGLAGSAHAQGEAALLGTGLTAGATVGVIAVITAIAVIAGDSSGGTTTTPDAE